MGLTITEEGNGKFIGTIEKNKTPQLSFDELMFEKLLKKFIEVLNNNRKVSYNEFEKFIKDLHPKEFNTTKCFELYDMFRRASYLYSYRFMDSLKENYLFMEAFVKYMNAKKSRIIDDLIERYV